MQPLLPLLTMRCLLGELNKLWKSFCIESRFKVVDQSLGAARHRMNLGCTFHFRAVRRIYKLTVKFSLL